MTAHYFIGIKVDKSIRTKLTEWQNVLADSMNYKDWTCEEDFHITLKFLGGCSDKTIETYKNKLMNEDWTGAFQINIGPAGYFGNPKQPRVFYADAEKPKELEVIKLEIEKIGSELGFHTEERTYRPHVTLAKKNAEGKSPLALENYDPLLDESYSMLIDHFSIFRIHPQQKPKYEEIAHIPLNKEI